MQRLLRRYAPRNDGGFGCGHAALCASVVEKKGFLFLVSGFRFLMPWFVSGDPPGRPYVCMNMCVSVVRFGRTRGSPLRNIRVHRRSSAVDIRFLVRVIRVIRGQEEVSGFAFRVPGSAFQVSS
jgi:hypothetical protein